MKLFQHIMLLAAPLLLQSCDMPPAQATLAPAAKMQMESRPALWKVTSAKSDSAALYLFGTIHLLPNDAKWQSAALDRAIEDSNSLTIELTGTDDLAAISAVFSAMAITKGLPPLSQRIDQKLLPQLKIAIANANMEEKTINRLETWAAAIRIAATTSANIGLGTSNAVEPILTARFAGMGKATRGLETITQQFSYFDQLAEADQRAMLNAILREAKQPAQTERLIAAWLNGDQDAIAKQSKTGIMALPKLRDVLLIKRNQIWTDQLSRYLDRGERSLVAVGAMHMAGKQGVPALMARKGYVVTRIQ
jgi:uncharacterized protein